MVFACVCAQVVGRKMKQAVLDQSEGEITKHSAGRFFFGILKRVNEESGRGVAGFLRHRLLSGPRAQEACHIGCDVQPSLQQWVR
jgi:hypothetical protein